MIRSAPAELARPAPTGAAAAAAPRDAAREDAARRSATARLVFSACMLLSGATALVYELLWLRRLQLVFGSTTYAAATTLAAFMGGLGAGAWFFGRRVDGSGRGVRTYGWLELGVAALAALSLPGLALVEQAYAALQRALQLGLPAATLLKLLLALPAIALPAALMGGTLPALTRGLLHAREGLGRHLGWLYGANTIGAAAGALLAGFVLIEHLGLRSSVLLAAACNLGVGLLALAWDRRGAPRTAPTPAPAPVPLREHLRTPTVAFAALSACVSGALSMSYELAWSRVLSTVLGSSTYTFALVLGVFLAGTAAGALLLRPREGGGDAGATRLAWLLAGLAGWGVASLAAIPLLPDALARLARVTGVSAGAVVASEGLCAAALLLVPAALLGAALPQAAALAARGLGAVGRDVGGVWLANTAGAIAGSLLGGFALIPTLGAERTLRAAGLVNLALVAVGALSCVARRGRRRALLVAACALAAAALLLPRWPAHILSSGVGHRLRALARITDPAQLRQRVRGLPARRISVQEGINATIAVQHTIRGVSLLVDGKPDASSYLDMNTQSLLGLLPMLIHPRPRHVAVIGWGSGVTPYAMTFFAELERLDAVELERAVVAASAHFEAVNGGVLRDPRLHLAYDDARSWLLVNRSRYDVIVSEPSNPWMAGVAALFSREFYRLVRRHLNRGGIFAQWVQGYRMNREATAVALHTFRDAFPHAQLWQTDRGNALLLGSDAPLRPSVARLRRAYGADPRIALHMGAYGPGPEPARLLGCFLLDGREIDALVHARPTDLTTDDRPLLEYHALRSLHTEHASPYVAHAWRVKLARPTTLPPMAGDAAPRRALEIAALLGSARLLRAAPVAEQITAHALQRYPDSVALRVARAAHLNRSRPPRPAAALALLDGIAAPPAELVGPLQLERAVALLGTGEPAQALDALRAMGDHRPATRRFYALRAGLRAGDLDAAGRALVELLDLPAAGDWDTLALPRTHLFRAAGELLARTGTWDRRLLPRLARDTPRVEGDLPRLELLLTLEARQRSWAAAAATLARLRAYGPLAPRLRDSCARVRRHAPQAPPCDGG